MRIGRLLLGCMYSSIKSHISLTRCDRTSLSLLRNASLSLSLAFCNRSSTVARAALLPLFPLLRFDLVFFDFSHDELRLGIEFNE